MVKPVNFRNSKVAVIPDKRLRPKAPARRSGIRFGSFFKRKQQENRIPDSIFFRPKRAEEKMSPE